MEKIYKKKRNSKLVLCKQNACSCFSPTLVQVGTKYIHTLKKIYFSGTSAINILVSCPSVCHAHIDKRKKQKQSKINSNPISVGLVSIIEGMLQKILCIRNSKRSTHAPRDRFFEMAAELRGTVSPPPPPLPAPRALLLPRQCLFTAFLFFLFLFPLLGSQAPFYSLTRTFYIFFLFYSL